jgi:uracil-DNA glycosylase family 4
MSSRAFRQRSRLAMWSEEERLQRGEEELARLQASIRACRRCQETGYLQEARPIVSGRASDRLLVIGQAPGRRSMLKGVPFGGPGGRVLQQWLEQAGFPAGYLHRHVYLSSLTRCYPGANPRGNGDRRPSAQELALCRPFLEAELRLLRPEMILLVGTMAIEAFWGRVRLEEVVGTCREQEGARWLPLPHPSGVSRWLNDAQHQALLRRALDLLASWRREREERAGYASPTP